MRTTSIPHASFSFREYSLEDYPSQETTKNEQSNRVPLQLLLKLVNETDQHLHMIQTAVEEGKALKKVLGGKPLPERLLRATTLFRTKTVNAEMVLCNCYPAVEAAYPGLRKHLTDAANDSDRLLAAIDAVDTFTPTAKEIREKRAQQIKVGVVRLVKHVAALKEMIKEELAALKLQLNAVKASRRTDQLKRDVHNTNMEPILDGFRKKGWRVPECYETEATPLTASDAGLELSELLLQSVQKTKEHLLPDNALIGVIRFPTIIRLKSKLQDVTIKSCLHPKVGYSLYMVFGAYLVVDHAIAIGINRSIMRVHGEKGIEVDVEKFDKLLPYVMNEFPDWTRHLRNMRPALPVHASGMHYYSLMLPKNVVAMNGMQIGDWQFLQQRND